MEEFGLARLPGSRKGTPFAAQQAASNAANMARDHGVRSVDVRVSGPGSGRESAVRALAASGIEVRSIKDTTRFRTTAAVRPSAAECKKETHGREGPAPSLRAAAEMPPPETRQASSLL